MPTTVPNEEENVYFYLGHASDICTPDGSLDIRKVPDNCIYITQTVCGLVNQIPPALIRHFLNPANKEIWRNPIEHIQELKLLFGNFPALHIHFPGCTYVNSSFSPISDFETEQSNDTIEEIYTYRVNIGLSGLLSLQSVNDTPPINEYIDNKQLVLNKTQGDAYLPFTTIQEFFQGSLFPALEEKDAGSFYPAAYNKIKLEVNAGGDVKYDDFKAETNRIASHFPVSRLMELYPGIHYNFLCRVARNCEPQRVTIRRQHSSSIQNTPLNSLYRIIQNTYNPNNDQAVEFARGLEELLKSNAVNLSSLAQTTPFTLPKTKNYFRTLQLQDYEQKLQQARYQTFLIQVQMYMNDLFRLMMIEGNVIAAMSYFQNIPYQYQQYIQTFFNPVQAGGKKKKAISKRHKKHSKKTLKKRKA